MFLKTFSIKPRSCVVGTILNMSLSETSKLHCRYNAGYNQVLYAGFGREDHSLEYQISTLHQAFAGVKTDAFSCTCVCRDEVHVPIHLQSVIVHSYNAYRCT